MQVRLEWGLPCHPCPPVQQILNCVPCQKHTTGPLRALTALPLDLTLASTVTLSNVSLLSTTLQAASPTL
jgi:hypothetical protein